MTRWTPAQRTTQYDLIKVYDQTAQEEERVATD